jgi:transcriptional regulator with GAF, ATPase, and Fis domain
MKRRKDDDPTAREAPASAALRERVLLVIRRDGRGAVHRLPRTGTLQIGRGEGCAVRIEEPGVSRVHAHLQVGPLLAIEDLGSSNGTRLRGEPLSAHLVTAIEPGDTFEMGGVLLTVQERPVATDSRETDDRAATSEAMNAVLLEAARLARGTINLLVVGETGVGKDVLARQLHQLSPRESHPFLRLNCAALTESIVESELFGHEKGAFSGAVTSKRGLIEVADGGTIFLDEVAELPLPTQAKLLRALEQKEFFRVGAVEPRNVDVRFIAATNRNLETQIAHGSFRQDLFFRLAGATLRIPPLRERRSEIVPFARRFIEEAAEREQVSAPELTAEAADWLMKQDWPGNLRELKNSIERAVLLCAGDAIRPEHVTVTSRASLPVSERDRIVAALAQFGGNQTHAARFLSMSRNTLLSRIERYGIARPRGPA